MPHCFSCSTVALALVFVFGEGQGSIITQVLAQDACDPNYADACVPIASDVDCAGGSGNGPEYVVGPVRVVGS
jgi:hypothetical protein